MVLFTNKLSTLTPITGELLTLFRVKVLFGVSLAKYYKLNLHSAPAGHINLSSERLVVGSFL